MLSIGFLFIAAWYVLSLFQEIPFLQHEMVGQALWWITMKGSLPELIFDSEKMDCHPGRFRYIEYLFQGAYWKLYGMGILPRDFYDYSAITLALLSGWLLLKIFKKRELGRVETLVLLLLYFGSSQTFLIGLFHFRKAKILAAFFFLILVNASLTPEKIRRNQWLFFIFGIIGFITEPIFILFSPLLALACDLGQKHRSGMGVPEHRSLWLRLAERGPLRLSFSIGMGLLVGALLTFLLNNVIGVQYHENARIQFGAIPGKPTNFLNVANIPYFFKITADILLPQIYEHAYDLIGLILTGTLFGCAAYMIKKRSGPHSFLLIFVTSLPLAAFTIRPAHPIDFYSGYYGYPLLILFLLSLGDGFATLKRYQSRWPSWVLSLVVLSLFGFHQVGKHRALFDWKMVYAGSQPLLDKVYNDYALLLKIQKHMQSETKEPYSLRVDYVDLNRIPPSLGSYFDFEGRSKYTDLIYLFVPSVFGKEIADGRLIYEMEGAPLDPPTCKLAE